MSRVWRKTRWAAIPLMTWGLAACSASEEVTTQSVQPTKAAIAEPDCGSLKTEIDKLQAAKLPEKLQQAGASGAKKYNPTPDEWASFPRYNNLVETYTVKKCEPSLQQAKAGAGKPKAKTAAEPAKKTADAGAAMKAAAAKASSTAGTAMAAKAVAAAPAQAQAAAAQPAYQGVMMQIPPQPAEPKQ
jgi:hypothetical protein